MKKILFLVPCMLFAGVANAAYPVYPNYTASQNTQYIPQQTVAANPAAAPATRVTGALPRVGSNATSARQYYQPSSFDRLSDSGLYVGLSLAYATSIQGGIKADYASKSDGWTTPGAFAEAKYKSESVLPLQVSIGAALNSDLRVDFSYSRYSGLGYPDHVRSASDDAGGLTDANATGGAISATSTMLNLYYNLDAFTGNFAGGSLRPYLGAGLGISTNSIADYLVHDPHYYPEVADGDTVYTGQITGVENIFAYHAGGTTEQLSYMLEGGVTTEMSGGIKLDFFVRYMGLGKVQSSGSIVLSQTNYHATGDGQLNVPGGVTEEADLNPSVTHHTNWFESGNLATVDVGVRMRLQF